MRCTCVSGCITQWLGDFHLNLHTCAHAGALAVMSPCMTWVCVRARRTGVVHPYWECLHFAGVLSSHSPYGSSNREVLGKNWHQKFVYQYARLVVWLSPRDLWETEYRINWICFFLLAVSTLHCVDCVWWPWTRRAITVLAGNHIIYFTMKPFSSTILIRNSSEKQNNCLSIVDLPISVPFWTVYFNLFCKTLYYSLIVSFPFLVFTHIRSFQRVITFPLSQETAQLRV